MQVASPKLERRRKVSFHEVKIYKEFSGPKLSIGCDGLSLIAVEDWNSALVDYRMETGKHYWEVIVEDMPSCDFLCVGVSIKKPEISNGVYMIGSQEGEWAFAVYYRDARQMNKSKTYGQHVKRGDKIGVSVDMDKHEMSFSINGVNLGVAFNDLAGILYPAVSIADGLKIKLVFSDKPEKPRGRLSGIISTLYQ